MSDEWDQLQMWSGRIAAITALTGAVYAAYKAVRSGISKLMAISNRLQTISDQLTPNGGSSLYDAINRIEHRQIKTEQRERAFLHMHSDHMFELNRNLQLVWANHTFLKTIQVDSDRIEGSGWHNIICEQDRDRTIQQFENACKSSRNVLTQTKLLIGEDINNKVVANISGTAMFDSNQHTSGFLVVVKFMKDEDSV